MEIRKENFYEYITAYEEDELFYRDLYIQEHTHPETFPQYIASLDRNYIRDRKLFVPALGNPEWIPYLDEAATFLNIPGNILLSKHYRYTPGYTHEHEFFEILCIYEGEVRTLIQGMEHHLKAGDICITPPDTSHRLEIFDDSIAINIIVRRSTFQSTFFQLLAADNALSQFFTHVLYRKTKGNYLIFHTGCDDRVRSSLEDLYIEYLSRQKYSTAFLNTMLMMFWAQLLRYHENDIQCMLTKEYGSASITSILNYLSANYQSVTLGEAAGHFGFSAPHFSTLIKEGTGRTFLQIIRDIKLGQACRALKETRLPISSVCELAGYKNPEHFMRTFKTAYGMTPGEYRKAGRERL